MSLPSPESAVPDPVFRAVDYAHMAHALRLAERGLYTTQPNPRVGCVIARGDEVIGAGWHQRAGEPHAEVFALRAAGARARGATAYVTLEPCSHFGRTPPCADALLAARVARVVAASEDSNPQVSGGGFAKLRAAGVHVETGLLRGAARELNRGFFSRVEHGRPWLRVKLAMSLDGRTALANGQSKWISGEAARIDVQRWRARSSALLAGSGTVLADNPRLSARASLPAWAEGKAIAPLRVVLDRQLRTPRNANILDGSTPALIFHAADEQPRDDRFAKVELAALPLDAQRRLDLCAALEFLAQRGMNEVQVEAGPTLSGSLLQSGFVDELLIYAAPVLLGDKGRPLLALPHIEQMAQVRRLRIVDQRSIGDDLRTLYRE